MFAYCPRCGGACQQRVPDGDNRLRSVCDACDVVHYANPKTVVGVVANHRDQIQLARRAINPRQGFWTLPAGFLENEEGPEDGARREALEEACAEVSIRALLGVYALPHISQLQLMYLADVVDPGAIAAGPESLEVGLFSFDDVPWDDLAFPTVGWALRYAHAVRHHAHIEPQRRTREPIKV